MIIGVLKEPSPETRVSLIPEHIGILKKWNVEVCVENGAGELAIAPDGQYALAGARLMGRDAILKTADLILSVNLLADDDIEMVGKGNHRFQYGYAAPHHTCPKHGCVKQPG